METLKQLYELMYTKEISLVYPIGIFSVHPIYVCDCNGSLYDVLHPAEKGYTTEFYLQKYRNIDYTSLGTDSFEKSIIEYIQSSYSKYNLVRLYDKKFAYTIKKMYEKLYMSTTNPSAIIDTLLMLKKDE